VGLINLLQRKINQIKKKNKIKKKLFKIKKIKLRNLKKILIIRKILTRVHKNP